MNTRHKKGPRALLTPFLVTLVLALGLLSCQTVPQVPPAAATASPETAVKAGTPTQRIKLACVGDSITAGYQVKPRASYPAQLGGLLGPSWQVENFGVSGTTLLAKGDQPYRMTKAWKDSHDFAPDEVIIMLGTNDTKAQNWLNTNEDVLMQDLKDMVETYRALPGNPRVWIARPAFIVGEGQWGITQEALEEIMPFIEKVAAELKVPLIDIQGITRDQPGYYQEDNVHPNAEGYKAIAAAMYQALTGKTPQK